MKARTRKLPGGALVIDGRQQYGLFRGPLPEVNLHELRQPLPLGGKLAQRLYGIRMKEWQAFQVMDEHCIALIALYDGKFFSLGQFFLYERSTGRRWEYSRMAPPTAVRIARGLSGTTSRFSFRGLSLHVHNEASENTYRVIARCTRDQRQGPLDVALTGHVVADDALAVSLPFTGGRGMYSHKQVLALSGGIVAGGAAFQFSPASALMLMDDHKGFYPWPMRYDWVTAAWRDDKGRPMALNLTRNQALDPDTFNENALWHEGDVTLLPSVRFTRPGGVNGPWTIADEGGHVRCTFTPRSPNDIAIDLGLVGVEYHGPFGLLDGTVALPGGDVITIRGAPAMGEEKRMRA